MTSTIDNAYDLSDRWDEKAERALLSGVQALVRVPLAQLRADRAAGIDSACFVSGYQGSPLGTFDKELAAQRAAFDSFHLVHQPGVNEELAATSVMGSQLAQTFPQPRHDGVLGVWYGKGPGLDRASDAIRHAMLAGTSRHGGAVAFVGDDPACKSSSIPTAVDWAMADLNMATLSPGNIQEVIDLGAHAFPLSRISGLWTGIKIVTAVADGVGTAAFARVVPILPADLADGHELPSGFLTPPYSARLEADLFERRIGLARTYGTLNGLNRVIVDPDRAWLTIMAAGRVFHDVVEALASLGFDNGRLADSGIRLAQVSMPYPMDPEFVRRACRDVEQLLVVEEKRPFIETFAQTALYGGPHQPQILGKRARDGAPLIPASGGIDADMLVEPLRRVLELRLASTELTPARPKRMLIEVNATRVPFFCSGCPHNTGAQVPDEALVGAGIGCHGMALNMDPERVGQMTGTTQMGGEGAQWIGIAPFVADDHIFQNVGDGTFAHSASLAVRAAVAADVHITYKLLYNGAVAMTGGQSAPGAMSANDIASMMLLEGVREVAITTEDPTRYRGIKLPKGVKVSHRDEILDVQRRLARVPGVTMLIHDQQCALEKRRDIKKSGTVVDKVVINERICEGCGDCGVKSNCLSLVPTDTEFGTKTRIDQTSCNVDYSCLKGDCPSFATLSPVVDHWWDRFTSTRRAGERAEPTRLASGAADRLDRLVADLDEPHLPDVTNGFTLRMPGIGGTGVVTVSHVLSTAALLDGNHVTGLDQTGLAQKGGAVVSDLVVSSAVHAGTNKATAGGVDAYIVFDLVGALAPGNLEGCSPERTIAVATSAVVPTASMIGHPERSIPPSTEMVAQLGQVVRPGELHVLDAAAITKALFGNTMPANVLLLGFAYQHGCLPISSGAIERALELNKTAAKTNIEAFRWGRVVASDPDLQSSLLADATDAEVVSPPLSAQLLARIDGLPNALIEPVRRRVVELIDYQGSEPVDRYLRLVERVVAGELVMEAGSRQMSLAVIENFYKLIAYKDEYEVARLLLAPAALGDVSHAGGTRSTKVTWHLHPPMLKAIGIDHKMRLNATMATPIMKVLRAGRHLRGTRLDPFGFAKVRRIERELITEYEQVITGLVSRLSVDTLPVAVEIARLPDLVRGYEDVKMRNVDLYRQRLAALQADIVAGSHLPAE